MQDAVVRSCAAVKVRWYTSCCCTTYRCPNDVASDCCNLPASIPEPVAPVAAATTAAESADTASSGAIPKVTARRTEPSFAGAVKSRRVKIRYASAVGDRPRQAYGNAGDQRA